MDWLRKEFENLPSDVKIRNIYCHGILINGGENNFEYFSVAKDFYDKVLGIKDIDMHDLFLKEYSNFPPKERREHIRHHRHYMGIEKKEHIIYGEAAADFFVRFLGVKSEEISRLIFSLDDKLFSHCIKCGSLFDEFYESKNKLGVLSSNLDKMILNDAFEVTSSCCPGCKNSIRSCEELKRSERGRLFESL